MPDRPAVLLSDANVLIDYRDSDLAILALVVQHLAPVHVLRDVVDEVDDLSLARCGELGLRVIEVGPETLLQFGGTPAKTLTLRSPVAPRLPGERLDLPDQ